MMRLLISFLCFCALSFGAFAQQTGGSDRLWFSASIEPDYVNSNGAYVGSEIILHVQFVSTDPFKRIRLDLPIIEGVRSDILVRPSTRQIEIAGNEGYSLSGSSGYAHEARIAIVPLQSGTIVVPPITITGISEPGNVPSFEFEKVYPAQEIAVHPGNPDFAGDTWIVSRNVTMEESWSHAIHDIQNGDTVRRTVKLTVAGFAADELPELVLAPNDGHRVIHTELAIETEKTDAGFIAHMEQTWDIYVETEDVTYIDEIQLPYWNPETEETVVASVPQQRVEPLKRDALALRQTLREEALAEHDAQRLGLMILASIPAAALIGFFALAIWRALPTRADMAFWRASKQPGAPLSFYDAFTSWGRQTFKTRISIDQEQVSTLGERAAEQVGRMQRSLFGPRGGEFEKRRTAAALIWGVRRMTMARFASAIVPSLSRFLFLR